MITASLIALSLLQSAIPAASVTARADLGSMVWELFGPAEPVLAPSSVNANSSAIPLRQRAFYTDANGCIRPNGWAGLCRHYPVIASSDVLLTVDMVSFGEPTTVRPAGANWGCYVGRCFWGSWSSYVSGGLALSYEGTNNDYQSLVNRRLEDREFRETSVGLRTGIELEARGLIGPRAQGSSSTSSAYSGTGNFGGAGRSTAGAGGGSGYSGGGSGRSGGGGSVGGGKPGRDLP